MRFSSQTVTLVCNMMKTNFAFSRTLVSVAISAFLQILIAAQKSDHSNNNVMFLSPFDVAKYFGIGSRTLGVWLSVHPGETTNLNYDEKLEKVRSILSSRNYRRLTLMGKIAILKRLSQLVYVLSPLPLNVKAIKEVNKLLFAFLWNGKGDKIKRNTIINDYSNGGLKMIDIVSFSTSFKATFI